MDPLHYHAGSRSPDATLWKSLALYGGYLAIFFTTWVLNGVDYQRIGESVETTRLWYALPTLFGGAFLVVALSVLGWWREALFDRTTLGPRWVWILPVVILALILHHFSGLAFDRLTPELLLWSVLGGVGVGFGEEMITRGSLLIGLRSRFPEARVWLISTALFSALHVPNVLFGLPWWGMPFQVLLTFIFGSGLYVIRRLSGNLLLPMVLHGLWDSALFLGVATGAPASLLQYLVYPVAIVCTIAMLRALRAGSVDTGGGNAGRARP